MFFIFIVQLLISFRYIIETLHTFFTHSYELFHISHLFIILFVNFFTLHMQILSTHLALHSTLPIRHLLSAFPTSASILHFVVLYNLIQICLLSSWRRLSYHHSEAWSKSHYTNAFTKNETEHAPMNTHRQLYSQMLQQP